MTSDDIDNVVKIEEEAYGEHHWSKSAFYDEMQNNLAKYYVAKNSYGELVGYMSLVNYMPSACIANDFTIKSFSNIIFC